MTTSPTPIQMLNNFLASFPNGIPEDGESAIRNRELVRLIGASRDAVEALLRERNFSAALDALRAMPEGNDQWRDEEILAAEHNAAVKQWEDADEKREMQEWEAAKGLASVIAGGA